MHVVHEKLHGRPVGSIRHPQVKVLSLAKLKEEAGVAGLHSGNLVEQFEIALRVELDLFLMVRQHAPYIAHEVAILGYGAARAENEAALLVCVAYPATTRRVAIRLFRCAGRLAPTGRLGTLAGR